MFYDKKIKQMNEKMKYIISLLPNFIKLLLDSEYSKWHERRGDHKIENIYFQTSTMSEYEEYKKIVGNYKTIIYNHNNEAIIFDVEDKIKLIDRQEVWKIIIWSPYGHSRISRWEDINVKSYTSIVWLLQAKGDIFDYSREPALNLKINNMNILFYDEDIKYKSI